MPSVNYIVVLCEFSIGYHWHSKNYSQIYMKAQGGTEVTGLKQDESFMRCFVFFTEHVPAVNGPADAPLGLAVDLSLPPHHHPH